jgi:hypothetical protein
LCSARLWLSSTRESRYITIFGVIEMTEFTDEFRLSKIAMVRCKEVLFGQTIEQTGSSQSNREMEWGKNMTTEASLAVVDNPTAKSTEDSGFKKGRSSRIIGGEERYTLKQWREDLRKEIDCEWEDESTREAHFAVCASILYLGVCLIDHPKVKGAFLQINPVFNKDKEARKLAATLIRDIRKDYRDFEELLIAIVMRKIVDFVKLGLREDAAINATNRWLREEMDV